MKEKVLLQTTKLMKRKDNCFGAEIRYIGGCSKSFPFGRFITVLHKYHAVDNRYRLKVYARTLTVGRFSLHELCDLHCLMRMVEDMMEAVGLMHNDIVREDPWDLIEQLEAPQPQPSKWKVKADQLPQGSKQHFFPQRKSVPGFRETIHAVRGGFVAELSHQGKQRWDTRNRSLVFQVVLRRASDHGARRGRLVVRLSPYECHELAATFALLVKTLFVVLQITGEIPDKHVNVYGDPLFRDRFPRKRRR